MISQKVGTTVVGVAVVALAAAVISGAAAAGLVWGLRAMGPDVPEEPEWPSSVESVTSKWSLRPGITFRVTVRLNTRDDEAVILAARHAVAVRDPNGHGRAVQVSFKIEDRHTQFVDMPLPLDERQLATELAEIPPP